MALNTLTLVTEINNLSDARYCAGMGVDIIGFNLAAGQDKQITAETVREIAGWLAGVQLAGAFADGSPVEEINAVSRQCGLNLVILNSGYLIDDLADIELPVILQVDINKDSNPIELLELQVYQSHVKYFLISSTEFTTLDDSNLPLLKELALKLPVLLGFGLNKANVLPVLEAVKPAGIALKGGHEIKPGLKDFDELADILEMLEVD